LGPISFAILVIALVAASGLAIGSLQIRGIGLGPAGVLFAGLIFSNFGGSIDPQIAGFTKEFGLILFVYTIGLHLGPGIVHLWKQQGLLLNAQALAIVLQGVGLIICFLTVFGYTGVTAVGLFSGATTNTPSLGAAEQAVLIAGSDSIGSDLMSLTAAYAVAYPGGVVGIIAAMVMLRYLFRVDVDAEAQQLRSREESDHEPIQRCAILVDNNRLTKVPFCRIPGVEETGVRISRIMRAGEEIVHPATEETELHANDVVQVVGLRRELDRFTPLIGSATELDLMQSAGDAEFRRIFVTETRAVNRPLRELSLDDRFGATVTRVLRGGVEMTPRGSSRLHFGDVVQVVGDARSLDRVTEFLGNSGKSLSETRFSPLFVGIALGVVLGMVPVQIPGVPFSVRLGLAGGPLIAGIIFSLIGSVGKFVWYIPHSANLALRELGIILFLACAGLGAGPSFFAAVMSWQGLQLMIAGLVVTIIPLLTTGIVARLCWQQSYLVTCGVVAGSMTDPPALAFANSQSDSEAASMAYAAVYPLTMMLRIIAAQSIVFLYI